MNDKLVITQSKTAFVVESIIIFFLSTFFFSLISFLINNIFISYFQRIALNVPLFVMYVFTTSITIFLRRSSWKHTSYVIDKDTIKECKGIVGNHCYSYGLKGMVSMEVSETFISQYFDYGNLTLRFLGGAAVVMLHVTHPEKVMANIYALINKTPLQA